MKILLVIAAFFALAGQAQAADAYPAQLPAARLCSYQDLFGVRRMALAYEDPAGEWLKSVNLAPNQYWMMTKAQRLVEVRGAKYYVDRDEMDTILAVRAREGLRQFVLTKESVLYLYLNRKPVDAYHCRVVAETEKPFVAGDIMLTKAAQENKARVMRVYRPTRFKEIRLNPKPWRPNAGLDSALEELRKDSELTKPFEQYTPAQQEQIRRLDWERRNTGR